MCTVFLKDCNIIVIEQFLSLRNHRVVGADLETLIDKAMFDVHLMDYQQLLSVP